MTQAGLFRISPWEASEVPVVEESGPGLAEVLQQMEASLRKWVRSLSIYSKEAKNTCLETGGNGLDQPKTF